MKTSSTRVRATVAVVAVAGLAFAGAAQASTTKAPTKVHHAIKKTTKHPKKKAPSKAPVYTTPSKPAPGYVYPTTPVVAPTAGVDSVSGVASLGVNPLVAGPITIGVTKKTGAAATSATGYFDGNVSPSLMGLPLGGSLLHLAGPIDCLDIEGNQAGFIYPIAYSNLGLPPGLAIRITVVDNGGNGKDQIGFIGPAPESLLSVGGCAPLLAGIPLEGHFTVHHG